MDCPGQLAASTPGNEPPKYEFPADDHLGRPLIRYEAALRLAHSKLMSKLSGCRGNVLVKRIF